MIFAYDLKIRKNKMTKPEASEEMKEIIRDAETLIENGHYTLEDIVGDIQDTLVHLVPK